MMSLVLGVGECDEGCFLSIDFGGEMSDADGADEEDDSAADVPVVDVAVSFLT